MSWSALVAWGWQGVALAAVVAAFLRFSPRLSATTRHLAWWVALVGVLALPLMPAVLDALRPGVTPGERVLSAPMDIGATLVVPAVPAWATATLVGLWLGVVILSLCQVARGAAHVARMKRQSHPMPAHLSRQLRLSPRVGGSGRAATLRISDAVSVPCALGLGPAVILLPRRLVETLDPDALDQIVLHEHAHLVRRDDWWRLVQAVVEAVVGVHPAVRWIGRQIEIEREAACDDAVVAQTGSPRRYASCLAEVAHASARLGTRRRGMPALVPGVARSPSVLRQRVVRLLSGRRNRGLEPAWSGLAAGVAGIAGLVMALGQAPPVVAFRADPSASGVPIVLASADVTALLPGPRAAPATFEAWPRTPDASPAERAATPRPTRLRGRGLPDDASRPAARVIPVSSPSADERRADTAPTTGADEPLPAVSRFAGLHTNRPSLLSADAGSGALLGRTGEESPWQAIAETGLGVGRVSKKSGLAVAGFFTRAGQTVAGAF